MITILDVSKYQGPIDWRALATSGKCDGVILKATDGQTGVDQTFAANFDGAAGVDLLEGAYHFAQPDETSGDAAIEARHFVSVVQSAAAKLPARTRPLLYALDIEKARDIRKGPAFVAWCRTFVETVESLTGLVCWVYTGGPFWNESDGNISADDAAFFVARPLWIAAYVNDPTPYVRMTPWAAVGWAMHQKFGDVGPGGVPGLRYPGIPGNVVDTNYFRGSLDGFRALIAQRSPDAAPDTERETPTGKSGQMRAVDPGTAANDWRPAFSADAVLDLVADTEPPGAA